MMSNYNCFWSALFCLGMIAFGTNCAPPPGGNSGPHHSEHSGDAGDFNPNNDIGSPPIGSPPDDNVVPPDDSIDEDCEHEPLQSASQACCRKHGEDACRIGLFCAVFDGRTLTTCYADGVRTAGESCFEDRHCYSKSCDMEKYQCRAAQDEDCSRELGCVRGDAGENLVCVDRRCVETTGERFEHCTTDDDCLPEYYCRASQCNIPRSVGGYCQTSRGCLSNKCVAGECAPPDCEEGLTACESECVDLQNDEEHCGGCKTKCWGVCQEGECSQ